MPKDLDTEAAFELSLKLSRLSVAQDKHKALCHDLAKILDYVDVIDSTNTEEVEALHSPLELAGAPSARLRPDSPDATYQPNFPLTDHASTDLPSEESGSLLIVPNIIDRDV